MAVANTLEMVTGAQSVSPQLFGAEAERIFRDVDSVLILACGTSYHAGMVARYWLEALAGIPCSVEIASEYRYRESVPKQKGLVVTVSQSGETADTIAALQYAKSLGHRYALSICNVPESSLVRASNLRFLTRAGPEIGVASTKAFTTQLAALALLTMILAKMRGRLPAEREAELLQSLRHLPRALERVLHVEPQVRMWSEKFAQLEHALFLGRHIEYPIAMEGALKLKEISYVHAEAYAAGELRHGPLALVGPDPPGIAIVVRDHTYEKMLSNIREVDARGAPVLAIGTEGDKDIGKVVDNVIYAPAVPPLFAPVPVVVALQLFSYHVARIRGCAIDKPRNLAKSVTVE